MSEETRAKDPNEKHLDKLTIKELRELAAEIPHEKALLDMKKEELLALIREARGITAEEPSKPKKRVVKSKMTKPELKARIRELRALKDQAAEAREDKKADTLRHQIGHLKKRMRRIVAA